MDRMDRRRTMMNEFKDTLVAKLFLAEEEWEVLRPRSMIGRIGQEESSQVACTMQAAIWIPPVSNITRKLDDIISDLLLVFCARNLNKVAAALKVLEEVNTELQGAGHRKLGVHVKVAKLVSQLAKVVCSCR